MGVTGDRVDSYDIFSLKWFPVCTPNEFQQATSCLFAIRVRVNMLSEKITVGRIFSRAKLMAHEIANTSAAMAE